MTATFNPHDPAFLQNPYPVYERLRRETPIFFDDASGLWFCTRFKDVDFFLRDRRFGRAIDTSLLAPEQMPSAPPTWLRAVHKAG